MWYFICVSYSTKEPQNMLSLWTEVDEQPAGSSKDLNYKTLQGNSINLQLN